MIRAIDLITDSPWAITPGEFERISTIALRENEGPEAVAARLGRPLENTRHVTERDGTAIIPITGPIFRRANLFTEISGATSVEILATDIQAAIDNPSVSRLLLDVDSPGGQAAGIGDLAALIHASPKPVTAFVGNMAASAAYWLAAAADHIVVSPNAMLGSIGVVASFRPEKDAPVKIINSQSPLKQAGPDTEPGRAEIQRVVDDLAAVFISDVAAYRHTDPDTVAAGFGRGGLLVGAKAVAAGMADAVGTLETLLASFTHASAGAPGITAKGPTMTDTTPSAPTIDRAYLATAHPVLLAALLAEGADTERTRIQGVRALAIPGHEALIERLAFDGATSVQEAAVQILAAEKTLLQRHADAQATAAPPVAAVLPPDHTAAATQPAPEKAAVSILANYRHATGTAA
jgi:ClpP class serine protease